LNLFYIIVIKRFLNSKANLVTAPTPRILYKKMDLITRVNTEDEVVIINADFDSQIITFQ